MIGCFLLETGEIIEQHTAVNLANYLEEVIARWNLPATQISAVVASNITAAIPRLEWQRLSCFSQLSVHKALNLPAVSRAIGQGKRLVGHFHSSVKSTRTKTERSKTQRTQINTGKPKIYKYMISF